MERNVSVRSRVVIPLGWPWPPEDPERDIALETAGESVVHQRIPGGSALRAERGGKVRHRRLELLVTDDEALGPSGSHRATTWHPLGTATVSPGNPPFPVQYVLYGRNFPLMEILTRSPAGSSSRVICILKSIALMIPSPNSSEMSSLKVVP